MLINAKQLRTDLNILLAIIAILLTIGGLFVYSSSSVYALETFGASNYFIKKQIAGLIIGLIALIAASCMPINFIKKMTPLFFGIALTLTTLTLLPQFAHRVHGSSRWIRLFGVTFQPSELLKITLVLYIAYFLEKKMRPQQLSMRSYLPLLFILGLPSIILLKQPDFGFTITLLLTSFTLLFVAQPKVKQLFIGLMCLIPVAITLVLRYPYRLQRVLTFLNPWQDPQGAGFQIIQSLIAIGSGGIFGAGIAYSKQKFFYLPMQHTDFIFAIIAEETGFIGSLFLIFLYTLFLYFGLRIACNLTNRFAMFATLGFTVLISLQTTINIAVATGLAPTKGIGLPFVSYGNTALVTNLLMVGIIINVVRSARIS